MTEDRWYQGRVWHGMTLGGWLRLLAHNRFALSPSRVPTALSITVTSAVNTTASAPFGGETVTTVSGSTTSTLASPHEMSAARTSRIESGRII